jgi:hypothetical protein
MCSIVRIAAVKRDRRTTAKGLPLDPKYVHCVEVVPATRFELVTP